MTSLDPIALGRHKLAPRISPGKTIEGAVGALVLGAVVATFAGPTNADELARARALVDRREFAADHARGSKGCRGTSERGAHPGVPRRRNA